MSGCKNVVFSGGYGLNCVANYYYPESLQKDGIKLYAEPCQTMRERLWVRLCCFITVQHKQKKRK